MDTLRNILRAVLDVAFAFYKAVLLKSRELGEMLLSVVFESARNLIPSVNWDGFQGYLANINYFFPLEELIGFAVTLAGLLALVWAKRWLLGWFRRK